MKSQTDPPPDNSGAPGQATLSSPGLLKIKGTLREVTLENTTFCDRELSYLAQVQIEEVISIGSGITRPPNPKQLVTLRFHMGFQAVQLSKDLKLPGIRPGDTFSAQLREKPCFGSSEVYYEVFVYTIN